MIRLRLCIFGKNSSEVIGPPLCVLTGYLMSICFITGGINLDYSVKVKSARFLHSKVIICLFVINKYPRRHNFEAVQISCFSSNCLPLILVSISGYCLQQLLL